MRQPSERTVAGFARSPDGRVWAGTCDGRFVLRQGRWHRTGAELGHPDGRFRDLTVDRSGTLWTSGSDGTFRLAPGAERFVPEPRAATAGLVAGTADASVRCTPFPGPGHRGQPGLFALGAAPGQQPGVGLRYPVGACDPALKMDGDGGLWVSFARQGLFRHHEGHWARIDAARDGLPGNRPISMGRDAAGRVWLGYPGGDVAQPGNGRFKVWTPEQGLRLGKVDILEAWGDAMLAGGSEGRRC